MNNEDKFVRRRSFRDLLDHTLQVIEQRFVGVAVLTVAYGVVLIMLFVVFGSSLMSMTLPTDGSPDIVSPSGADTEVIAVPVIITIVGSMLATMIYGGGLISLVASHFGGGVALSIEDAIRFGLRNLPQLIGVTLLMQLALGALLLVAALAGPMLVLVGLPVVVWLFVKWSLAWQVVVLEGSGVHTALSRSWELLKGSWGRVFGIFLILVAPLVILLRFPGLDPGGFVGLFLAVVLTPIQYVVTTLLYGDLRARFDERKALDEPA